MSDIEERLAAIEKRAAAVDRPDLGLLTNEGWLASFVRELQAKNARLRNANENNLVGWANDRSHLERRYRAAESREKALRAVIDTLLYEGLIYPEGMRGLDAALAALEEKPT